MREAAMTFEPATHRQQNAAARLARAPRMRRAVRVAVALAVASLLAARAGSPPEAAPVAEQPAPSAVCKSRPGDCPWSMSSGRNNSCIDAELGRHHRWRCWKTRSA